MGGGSALRDRRSVRIVLWKLFATRKTRRGARWKSTKARKHKNRLAQKLLTRVKVPPSEPYQTVLFPRLSVAGTCSPIAQVAPVLSPDSPYPGVECGLKGQQSAQKGNAAQPQLQARGLEAATNLVQSVPK